MKRLIRYGKQSFADSLIVRGALLMVLALALFAAGSYEFIVRPTVNGLADAQMRVVSQQLEARVNLLLSGVESTLRSSRGWGVNGNLDHNQVVRFNEFFFSIIENHPEITSVNFAHECGHEIMLLHNADGSWVNRLSHPDEWGRRTYWLHWNARHELESVEMRMLDYDTRKRPWHRGAMALAEDSSIHWTDPYVFFTTKDPGITAAMRWTAPDGSRFVIGHDVRLIELSRFTAGLTVGKDGRAALFLNDGRLLALPRDDMFSEPAVVKTSVLKQPGELGLKDIEQGFAAWARGSAAPDELGAFGSGGRRWYSLFRPVTAGEQRFWLGVFAPEREFLPMDESNLVALAGIALLAVMIGVVVSIRIAYRFGQPLKRLAAATERIGRMELDEPVAVDAPWREVRQLAEAQEAMRVRLRDANALLEAQVVERTRELEESQAALREREYFFRAIFENASIGISSLTPELRRQHVNRAYMEFIGYAEEDLLDGSVLDVIAPEDRDRLKRAYVEFMAGHRQSFRTECGFIHRDGSLRHGDIQVNAIHDDAGISSLLVTVLDVTDRRLMEEELKRQFTLVKDAECEAQQARGAAEAAAAAKADFLASMSHEIRTPMNAIMGLAHIALQTDLTIRQRSYLEKIDAASRTLLGILNDVLDFSKIEAGMMPIESVDFSLDRVLEQLSDLWLLRAEDKGVALCMDKAANVPDALRGDPLRIQQVLMNLVGNALKFTERGEVIVRVRRMPGDGGGLRLRFEVSDTGIGMSEEEMARLFTPFTQADSSTTRRYGGTGLGLSICKRLVGLMGGEIGVTSAPGKGSTFHFEIPSALAAGEVAPARAPGHRGEIPQVLRGKRVLLVEDNEISLDMTEEILVAAGMDVHTAMNGIEAVELATSGYDVILMDCNMPLMDGYEATRRIRATPSGERVPILAMTAAAMDSECIECREAGMSDHIGKPFDVPLLYAKLARWMGDDSVPVPDAPAPSTFDDTPATLDRAAGIARLGGNADMYERLLARFRSDQADVAARMRRALADGDQNTARRLAHTLKGLAGNLGAEALTREAAELERALADENEAGEDPGERIASLEVELKRVMAAIEGWPIGMPPPSANWPMVGMDE